MQGKRQILLGASLSALLLFCACSKKPSLTQNAQNTANQQSAAPAPDSSNQANTNEAPPAANAANSGNAPVANSNAPNGNSTPADNTAAAPAPIIIPAGTPVTIRLQESLSSASAVAGERFDAVLDAPVAIDDQTILPVGTPVQGHVVLARRSGRLHHPGELGLTLDTVVVNQQNIPILTSAVFARGGSHKKRNLAWIGGGSGGGALIGALAAGGKGALIGGGVGAVAGTTTALLTGKKDVGFGYERRLTFRLHRDLNLPS